MLTRLEQIGIASHGDSNLACTRADSSKTLALYKSCTYLLTYLRDEVTADQTELDGTRQAAIDSYAEKFTCSVRLNEDRRGRN